MLRRIPSKSRAATRAAPMETSRDLHLASSVGAPLVGALPLMSAPAETSRDANAPLLSIPMADAGATR